MTDRLGEGGLMTNAGCVMRKSAARETKILSWRFRLLSVQGQNAVWVCLCVCGHVGKKKNVSVHICARLSTHLLIMFSEGIGVSLLHCRRRGTTAVLSIRFSRLYQQTLIKTSSPSVPAPAAARLAAMQMQALRKQPAKPCAGRPCKPASPADRWAQHGQVWLRAVRTLWMIKLKCTSNTVQHW